jgi:hypothetical protein
MGAYVSMKKISLMTFILVMVSDGLALANSGASPQSLLAVAAILPFMIILTLLGGGYAVLREIRGGRSWKRVFAVIAAVFAILCSAAFGGLPALLGLIFSIIALQRGLRMITWGLRSLRGNELPDYLKKARSWRLIPSGGALVLVTLFLMGMIATYTGYSWKMALDNWRVARLKEVVTHRLACAKLENPGAATHGIERDPVDLLRENVTSDYNVLLDSGEGGNSFRIYLTPTRMPFFPYNYMEPRPSYFADETGKIRMIRVRWAGTLCPPDAPVVIQVSENDVQKEVERMLKRGQGEGGSSGSM